MSQEREENINSARSTFEFLAEILESELAISVSWDPLKNRKERTRLILAIMSYWRLLHEEYVFLDMKHLEGVVNFWKKWSNSAEEEYRERIIRWIQIYEGRLKHKKKVGEIGERFVDLSSSYSAVPITFSFILEYEASPYWGAIVYDFRKLLSILAPVKVGVFHLPKLFSTSKLWVQNEETGEINWENRILDSDKPDELIEYMKKQIKLNELEHSNTIYLVVLIHSSIEGGLKLHGYLLWREKTGEVYYEKLGVPKVESQA